jgi:hypothetical protein
VVRSLIEVINGRSEVVMTVKAISMMLCRERSEGASAAGARS